MPVKFNTNSHDFHHIGKFNLHSLNDSEKMGNLRYKFRNFSYLDTR